MDTFEKYSFGKKLLESQGWTSGKGLGRNESGITEALKPSLKFDKAGVGHNQADDMSFNWWDHVYKKAASNIIVEHSEEGVELKQKEDQPDLISTKKWKHKKKRKKRSTSEHKPLTYGVFMKSSVLTKDGEMKNDSNAPPSDEDDLLHTTDLDETLLKACEGRTAHKGARHGLTASGKLMRLEAQENGTFIANVSMGSKVAKQRMKHDTERKQSSATNQIVATEEENFAKKEKRKKRKSCKQRKESKWQSKDTLEPLENGSITTCDPCEAVIEHSGSCQNSTESFHKEKRKKHKKNKEII